MPEGHEAAEGGGLTASVPVHHQDGRLPAAPRHPQLLLVHQLDEVEHGGEGRGLLGPVVGLDHHQVPGQVVALQPQSDGAGHEVVLADEADGGLAVAAVPHHAGAGSVWPEGSVVLGVQVGQHHQHLHLLLRHHLPHGGDGALQRVLRQDETLPVVES